MADTRLKMLGFRKLSGKHLKRSETTVHKFAYVFKGCQNLPLIPSKLQICKFWQWIMFEKQGHRKLVDSNQINGDYNIKVIRNYDHGDNYLNDKILLFHRSIITLGDVNAVNYHLYLALLQYWWPIIPKHQVSCPLKILQFFLKLI